MCLISFVSCGCISLPSCYLVFFLSHRWFPAVFFSHSSPTDFNAKLRKSCQKKNLYVSFKDLGWEVKTRSPFGFFWRPHSVPLDPLFFYICYRIISGRVVFRQSKMAEVFRTERRESEKPGGIFHSSIEKLQMNVESVSASESIFFHFYRTV